MGKKQQKAGADWEKAVIEECELEQRRGRARVERRKPGMNILKSLGRGRFECVHAKDRTVDFEGVLEGGLAVRFDTKRTQNADRFDFSLISDEQLERMANLAMLGGVAFLYVLQMPSAAVRRHRWILPVNEQARVAGVAHRRSRELLVNETRESIRWDALGEEFEVLPSETWLDAFLRLRSLGIFAGRGAA